MVDGYLKMFNSILDSSVWAESTATRCVWVAMLNMVDYRTGIVKASFSGICRRANVTPEQCRDAIRVLEAPDLDSKSPEWGGRRIEKVEGGWLILNYLKYRDMQTPKQEQTAKRQRLFRERRAREEQWHQEHPGEAVPEDFHARYEALHNAESRPDTDADADADTDASVTKSLEEEDRPAIFGLQEFMAAFDFGPTWSPIVEGYIRASKKPINVMAELKLWLTGEMGRKKETPEIVGYALNQYAASDKADGFIPNLFGGFIRGAHRGIERNKGAEVRDQENATIAKERRDKEERERDERDQRMLVDFERSNPKRFAELKAAAEKDVPSKVTEDTRLGMIRANLIVLVRRALAEGK